MNLTDILSPKEVKVPLVSRDKKAAIDKGAREAMAKGKGKLEGVAMTVADDEDVFTTGASWDLP